MRLRAAFLMELLLVIFILYYELEQQFMFTDFLFVFCPYRCLPQPKLVFSTLARFLTTFKAMLQV